MRHSGTLHLFLYAQLFFVVVLGGACGGGGNGTTPTQPALSSIAVTPSNPTITLGLSQQLTATGTLSNGSTQNLSGSVTWSSSSNAVATVSSNGSVTSVSQGTTTITATSGSITGSTTVTVGPPALVSLTASAPSPIFEGTSPKAVATGTFTDGSHQDVSSTVTWSSAKSFIADVDAKGVITPHAVGMDSVTASAGSITASASFLVLAVPRFVFASSQHSDGISILTVDPQASRLRNIGYQALGSGVSPLGITSHPSKPWIYGLNDGAKQVDALSIVTNGTLAPISGGPFTTGDNPSAVATDPSGRFLFVANAGSNNISAFSIDQSTGALNTVPGSPFPTGSAPSALAAHPSGKFLYTTNRLGNTVSIFGIDSNSGALTAIGNPIATGPNPTAISADPSGNFVFVGSTAVYAYTVTAATGTLTPVASSPFGPGGMFLESIAIDPAGKYLYSGDGVSQTIVAFSINATSGALGAIAGSPFSTCNNPTGISADPSDKYLYVSCGGLSAVWGYSINPTNGVLTKSAQVGALDSLTGITITGGGAPITFASTHAYVANATDQTISVFNIDSSRHTLIANGTVSVSGPTSLAIDALGKWLYSANSMGSSITRDAVQTDGTLSSPQQLPLQNPGFFPEGLVIDPSRRWLLVPENSGYLGIFNIDAVSGMLTPNTASSNVGIFPIGGNPAAAAIQPNGQTIYIADFSANVIDAYGINADTGAVNPAFKQPFIAGTNPTALAIDPTGSFLYAANFGSNDISAYVINSNSNNLVAISANVPAGTKPAALIVDGSGTYLYVANQGDGTISAFKIDPASGALSAIANSPFPGVTAADAISLDATGQYLYITSQSANTATAYKINGSDGSLTFLSTVGTGSQPRAIVTDTTIQ